MWIKHTYCILLLSIVVFISGCNLLPKDKTNWGISLKKEDKKPYGSYLAYESLKYFFTGKKIETLSNGFRYTSLDEGIMKNSKGANLLILLGLDFYVSQNELEQLLHFVNNGNEIVLFCSNMDSKLEALLGCYKQNANFEELKLTRHNNGKNNIDALFLPNGRTNPYGYEGRSLQGHFVLDSNQKASHQTLENGKDGISVLLTDTLGYMQGLPDFVRYEIGKGHITIHAAPLVMSNYFLLQKNNHTYLEGIWHTLPTSIANVYWNEYYKHNAEGSDLGVLLRYPSTKWALAIALLTLLLYVFFESRRRQRIIPAIEQPANASVSFAETVGRLYYNKGNHGNLAEKMIQHFLEWVRTQHHLNTNIINEDFAQNLSKRSGQPLTTVSELTHMIHEVRTGANVEEAYLYRLHNLIQTFYNNHTS